MSEAYEVVTPATVAPVSVSDMALHLRLNDSSENALLADWVTAAADLFARTTKHVLTATTMRLRLDGWPFGTIYINRYPVTSVTSVQYLNTAGTWQTVSTDNYTTDLVSTPARISFIDGFSYPDLHATAVPNVRVQFVAGNALAANCDRLALIAIKMLVAHWYRSREAHGEVSLTEVPHGWADVCAQYGTGVNGYWN